MIYQGTYRASLTATVKGTETILYQTSLLCGAHVVECIPGGARASCGQPCSEFFISFSAMPLASEFAVEFVNKGQLRAPQVAHAATVQWRLFSRSQDMT